MKPASNLTTHFFKIITNIFFIFRSGRLVFLFDFLLFHQNTHSAGRYLTVFSKKHTLFFQKKSIFLLTFCTVKVLFINKLQKFMLFMLLSFGLF